MLKISNFKHIVDKKFPFQETNFDIFRFYFEKFHHICVFSWCFNVWFDILSFSEWFKLYTLDFFKLTPCPPYVLPFRSHPSQTSLRFQKRFRHLMIVLLSADVDHHSRPRREGLFAVFRSLLSSPSEKKTPAKKDIPGKRRPAKALTTCEVNEFLGLFSSRRGPRLFPGRYHCNSGGHTQRSRSSRRTSLKFLRICAEVLCSKDSRCIEARTRNWMRKVWGKKPDLASTTTDIGEELMKLNYSCWPRLLFGFDGVFFNI